MQGSNLRLQGIRVGPAGAQAKPCGVLIGMHRRSNTTIRAGMPNSQAVLVDGVPMDCVSRVEYDLAPGKLPTATLHLTWPHIETDYTEHEPPPVRHRQPDELGVMSCCGKGVSQLPKGHLVTWDPSRVTCRGR